MSAISIDKLTPGMVLAMDVIGDDGRVLLYGGVTLTEMAIEALKSRGVVEADVRPPYEEDPLPFADVACIQRAAEHLSQLFQYADPGHEAVLEIFRLTLDGLALAMTEGLRPDAATEGLPNPDDLELDDFLRDDGSPRDLAAMEAQLSSLPDVYHRIMEALNSSTASVSRIADAISKDPGLAAKLLKMVNSAFYGFPSKVDTIPRAVMLIGVAEVSMLALGVSVIQAFSGIPRQLTEMRAFWMHSIACGVLARNIARRKADLSPERSFVGGLLHDVGRLVMYKHLPRASTQALLHSRFNGLPTFESEKDVFGFNHARIGGLLLREWSFPQNLVNMVRFHHAPGSSSMILEPAVVHLADCLAVAGDMVSGRFTHFPGIQPEAWNALGLPVEALAQVVKISRRQIEDIQNIFLEGV